MRLTLKQPANPKVHILLVSIFNWIFLINCLLGKKRDLDGTWTEPVATFSDPFAILREMVESPENAGDEFTRIKKDIFHAFHMIPIPVNHGHRAGFLCSLRDHLMRWDPTARAAVDKICQKVYGIKFDDMLIRNPRYIAARTPRHVPPPSVLVPAIEHVYKMFGNALDAKTGAPLFSKQAWQKAKAVLELARQGYLSDIDGIVLYERAGVDQHGLQLWKCLRGTNKVEGGPHGDIYRKFGALHGEVAY